MFELLYGNPVKEDIEKKIIEDVRSFGEKSIFPKIAVVRVGEDPGQLYYEKAIIRQSEKYGIKVSAIDFDESTDQEKLEQEIERLNAAEDIHGIVLLRPLPESIDEDRLRSVLLPSKDIDAITDISIAELFAAKQDAYMACTAEACLEIMKWYHIDPSGKRVTILGRSLTVGKPLAIMMLNNDARITVCHSKTPVEDKIEACRNADIVVLATGNTQGFGSEYFRNGQVVLDIGTGIGRDGKMHGDMDIEEIMSSGKIDDMRYTPVPGGIGKVTTALLLRNIIKAAKNRAKVK